MKQRFAGSGKRKLVLGMAALLITLVLLVLTTRQYGLDRCRGTEIFHAENAKAEFVSENEVMAEVEKTCGVVEGKKLSEIDVELIESAVSQMPFVQKAEVWLGLDGRLRVEITERSPLARVQNAINQHYYINTDGSVIPVIPGKAARVVFASGYIIETVTPGMCFAGDTAGKSGMLLKSPLYKVYVLADVISRNDFLKAQIDQIYFEKSGEIELYPKVGRHVILFGDIDRAEEKFRMLQAFYKKSVFIEGWSKYDTINLKYRKQVICS